MANRLVADNLRILNGKFEIAQLYLKQYQDNIGFHCDIDYGNTSYEMSCVIALNKMDEEGAIKVLPSSHAQPLLATVAIENERAPKGSKLGFRINSGRLLMKAIGRKCCPFPWIVERFCVLILVLSTDKK